MTSYFDEHDCVPLASGQSPNLGLQFARLLITGGYWEDHALEFSQIFGEGSKAPPPTSKTFLQNLPKEIILDKQKMPQCPICLKEGCVKDETLRLPCKHIFHASCLTPWVEKTSSCPVCRHELPTDDEYYEEYKRQKKRTKEREADLETLHNSMFS